MMPKHLEDQLKEIETLEKELLASEGTTESEVKPTEPIVEPVEEPVEKVVEPEVEVKEPEVISEPKVSDTTDEKWEQKFKVLQGKYDAEVPRLHSEMNYLRGKLETLEKVTPVPVKEIEKKADPVEIEGFKKDYPDIYKAVSMLLEEKNISSKVDEDKFKKIEETIDRTSKQTFESLLSNKVADWNVLNENPKFIEWLSKREGRTPYTRHQWLVAAYENQDIDTVAGFFNDFKSENKPVEEIKKEVVSKKEDLGKFVSPKSKNTETSHSDGGDKKIYSKDEIEKFYRDLAMGKLRLLTPEQIAVKEGAYWSAMSEGRVK
jgi:hypothetical protein